MKVDVLPASDDELFDSTIVLRVVVKFTCKAEEWINFKFIKLFIFFKRSDLLYIMGSRSGDILRTSNTNSNTIYICLLPFY